MKVLNINEEQLVNIGIEHILQNQFETVELISSSDYKEILDLLSIHDFDIILIDIGITSMNISKVMKRFQHTQSRAKILIFSQTEYKKYAIKYISYGASGFLEKSASKKEVVMAINLVRSGQIYFSKEIIMSYFNNSDSNLNHNGQNIDPLNKLSRREMEVFKMILQGKRIKDISEAMQIHQSTTSTLKKRIMKKFKVDNLMKLKNVAMEYGY